MKNKIMSGKCCDKCWNSEFALRGKNKERFGCGLSCECHGNPEVMGLKVVEAPTPPELKEQSEAIEEICDGFDSQFLHWFDIDSNGHITDSMRDDMVDFIRTQFPLYAAKIEKSDTINGLNKD